VIYKGVRMCVSQKDDITNMFVIRLVGWFVYVCSGDLSMCARVCVSDSCVSLRFMCVTWLHLKCNSVSRVTMLRAKYSTAATHLCKWHMTHLYVCLKWFVRVTWLRLMRINDEYSTAATYLYECDMTQLYAWDMICLTYRSEMFSPIDTREQQNAEYSTVSASYLTII